jgi:hypothetical protein
MNSDFTAVAKWRIESEHRLKSDILQTSRLPGGFPRLYSTPPMITLWGMGLAHSESISVDQCLGHSSRIEPV